MIPLLDANENARIPTNRFLGLNRLDKGNDGEFLDMVNMGSSHYPCLAPRGKRRLVYTAAEIDPEAEEQEILGIFMPIDGQSSIETGFSGVTKDGVYNAGVLAGIETDKTRGGWFKGNRTHGQLFGPIRTAAGANSVLISFYNPAREQIELLRLWKTVNADVLGEETDGIALENLRRGIAADQADSEVEAVFTDVEAGYFLGEYCIKVNREFGIESQGNVETGIVRVTGENGNRIEFPAGTFRYRRDQFPAAIYKYQLEARREDGVREAIQEITGETGLQVEILKKNSIGYVNTPKNSEKSQTEIISINQNATQVLDYEKYFDIGDELEIEGFTKDASTGVDMFKGWCISARVEKDSDEKAVIKASKSDAESNWGYISPTLYTEYVVRKIPKTMDVCVHQNRLWCASASGNYIYASALGDFGNFYRLDGVDDNSAYFEVNTPGAFIGITSYRDTLLAFKRNSISIVYGNTLANYSVEQTIDGIGCIDGQSIYTVNGTLYFLGEEGFFAYNGSQPEMIGRNLNCRYDKAYGFGDANCYYASARRADTGEYELLCFDSRYGIWTKEDGLQVISAVYYQNHLYAATKDAVYELNAKDGTEAVQWEATGVILYEETFTDKGMNELRIRAKIPEGSTVQVYTSVNGEEFTLHKEITPVMDAQGQPVIKIYRVPVRFQNAEFYQIKLAGRGECVIYDVERAVAGGGKVYQVRR